jgi:hypothetical protein
MIGEVLGRCYSLPPVQDNTGAGCLADDLRQNVASMSRRKWEMRRRLAAGLLALAGATGSGFAADLSPPLPTTKAPVPASAIN